MRIIYHHRTASRDGQSTHIEEMVRGLRTAGVDVSICSPVVGESDPSGGSGGWVGRLKALLPKRAYELAEILYSLVAYRKLLRAVQQSDVKGIYERYNLYLLAGVWVKRKTGIPLVLEVNAPMALERRQYGGLSWPRLADWAERFVWTNADYVLPVSDVLAQCMIAQGVDARRIVVIPNGINEEDYVNLPSNAVAKAQLGLQGRLVVGFTGFVREWDRLDRIVRWVAARAERHNVHLLIVGDGPARADIDRCARELNVADRVTFTGAVPRKDVPALAAAFDIALQTALVPYASPLCLFEYLALGKAIVAPNQPNHREILIDRVDALLYDPVDGLGVEAALDELCDNPVLRESIAASARDVIGRKGLTWERHAARVKDLFYRGENLQDRSPGSNGTRAH